MWLTFLPGYEDTVTHDILLNQYCLIVAQFIGKTIHYEIEEERYRASVDLTLSTRRFSAPIAPAEDRLPSLHLLLKHLSGIWPSVVSAKSVPMLLGAYRAQKSCLVRWEKRSTCPRAHLDWLDVGRLLNLAWYFRMIVWLLRSEDVAAQEEQLSSCSKRKESSCCASMD